MNEMLREIEMHTTLLANKVCAVPADAHGAVNQIDQLVQAAWKLRQECTSEIVRRQKELGIR